jgi:predicted transposase YbfD/YdcC
MNKGLIEHFETLPDPRVERTRRYPLNEIILLIVAGTVSGCDGWKSIKDFGEAKLEWLRKFLPYKDGIPVDDTLARVMRKIETKAFQTCFIGWVQAVSSATSGDVVAIDGKTLRRSHNRKYGVPAIHMVSAWSSENGLVLGQEKTAEKSNEITAIPQLLDVLELKGCIVTIDAMGCQTVIAEKIIQKKADYVLALKGNQGNLYSEVSDFFKTALTEHFKGVAHDYYEEHDAGHGRVELRQCWAITPSEESFPTCKRWPNLKSLIVIKSRREFKDPDIKATEDTRFYIASIEPDAKKTLIAVRQHWGVENNLHWTLDMTFREDESRIRTEAAPENFAIMRHIALNLIKNDTSRQASVKRKRFMAALEDNFRETIIRQVI